MSVSRYPSSAFRSGKLVSPNGSDNFLIDCQAADDFYLDFSSLSLASSSRYGTPTYVGGLTQSFAGGTANVTISLTSLSLQDGDTLVVGFAIGNDVATSLESKIEGFDDIAILGVVDNSETYLVVAAKQIAGTPDTSIRILGGTGNTRAAGVVAVHAWRGISIPKTGFEPSSFASNEQINTVLANPPAITPTYDNSLVIGIGAGAHDLSVAHTFGSSDLSNFITAGSLDSTDIAIGMGSIGWTGGAVDPAAFTFSGSDDSSFSSIGFSLVLTPDYAGDIPSSIDFTNIPNSIKDINVFGYAETNRDIALTWDTDLVQLSTPPSLLETQKGFSLSAFAFNENIFSKNSVYGSTLQKIQKTEIIRYSDYWTAPSDVSQVEVLLCGGGGAGSDVSGQWGGSGSAIQDIINVVPGSSYLVTIGAGGAWVSSLAGLPGSATSFGTLMSVPGGGGGGGSPGTPGGSGGIGGNGSTSIFSPTTGINGYGDGGAYYLSTDAPANSGRGGGAAAAATNGGSGVCIIRYWSFE
jgi:hypothetical protein